MELSLHIGKFVKIPFVFHYTKKYTFVEASHIMCRRQQNNGGGSNNIIIDML